MSSSQYPISDVLQHPLNRLIGGGDVTVACLVSGDGILWAFAGDWTVGLAEIRAAAASGVFASSTAFHPRGQRPRQSMIEFNELSIIIVQCGQRTLLAVSIIPAANLDAVIWQVKDAVKKLGPHINSQVRGEVS